MSAHCRTSQLRVECLEDRALPSLLVSSFLTDSVLAYDESTGAFLGTFAAGAEVQYPTGLALGPDGNVYVGVLGYRGAWDPFRPGMFSSGSILRYDAATGAPRPSSGNTGATFLAADGILSPRGLTFGPDGDLYISNFYNDGVVSRILRYTTDAEFVDTFGVVELTTPEGLAFGPDGNLYVADPHGSSFEFNIHRFRDGVFLDSFGTTPDYEISHTLAFDSDGDLYVGASSFTLASIFRYNSTSDGYDEFSAHDAFAIAFGPDGDLYASGYDTGGILRIDGETGALLDQNFVPAGSGGLNDPRYLLFAPFTPTTHADIAVTSARLRNARTVEFEYQVTGGSGPFEVGVYRSIDDTFDSNDIRVDGPGALQLITPATSGLHRDTIPLAREIPIDPLRPYVLVVADPQKLIAETSETNNDDGHFRKIVLGAVTHGLQPTGSMGSWVTRVTDNLKSKGYDPLTRAFDWAAKSNDPKPNQAVKAGTDLGKYIQAAVTSIAGRSDFEPNDVIDLHLIGHSRGAVVISQALLYLQRHPLRHQADPTQFGYTKMTMLDPHPASNALIGGYAMDSATAAILATRYAQSKMRDPNVVIPSSVDEFEIYYQRSLFSDISHFSEDYAGGYGINLWGELPTQIENRSLNAQQTVYQIPAPVSHSTVTDWYMQYILPLIGMA